MYVLKEPQPTLFNSKVYIHDYFLIISPPKQIIDDVKRFKHELVHRIGLYDAANALAHISLFHFRCIEEQENKLIRQLEFYCRQQSKMQIQLYQFNSFEHSRTLFIDIANKKLLQELHHQLWGHLKLNMKGIVLPKRDFDPHLIIGKKLSSYQFPFAIEEFSDKQYRKNFFCNHLTLLKRSYDYRNEREFWMKAREIPLGETKELMIRNNQENKLPEKRNKNHVDDYKISFSVKGEILSDYLPVRKT